MLRDVSRCAPSSTASPGEQSAPQHPLVSSEGQDRLRAVIPRVVFAPGSNLSPTLIAEVEALLPPWVEHLSLSRRSNSPKSRDKPPRESASGSTHPPLLATIKLGSRPPLGAVQQLQLHLHALLGEWPYRHVVGTTTPTSTAAIISAPEAPLRKEILRSLPLGFEMIRLEEFLLKSGGATVRFLVLQLHCSHGGELQRDNLSAWKKSFQQEHGILVLIDEVKTPPPWIRIFREASQESEFMQAPELRKLVRKSLTYTPPSSSFLDRRVRRAPQRRDLTHLNWVRVDSKECLIAEDVFHVRQLPNRHTELLVGVIDVVSPGKPHGVPNRKWGSFLLGEDRNAIVSRFEFNREYSLCGFSTELALVRAQLKFNLADLEDLLRSDSHEPFVEGLRRLDTITTKLAIRRMSHDGLIEVSNGGSAGKMVFEPMVLFNAANAQWLRSQLVPLLYRVAGKASLKERQELVASLEARGYSSRALTHTDPLKVLMLLQQLDEGGDSSLCHRVLEGYIRSSRYSTVDDVHPGFARPYTGFKPKGGSGFNQLQLVRFLSNEATLTEQALQASFVSLQGRGPLVAHSRTAREALTALRQLFESPLRTHRATVVGSDSGTISRSTPRYLTVKVDGWDRLALLDPSSLSANDMPPAMPVPGMQLRVRPLGFDTQRMSAVFKATGGHVPEISSSR